MLPFRLRQDAVGWFKELHDRKEFKILFDDFYFCFIAGVAKRRKVTVSNEESQELINYFPEHYNNARANTLIALFLKSELDELGVVMGEKGDKREVHSSIAKLVDYSSPSKLSAAGVGLFNQYANGGFEVLTEWFDDKPRTLETFLRTFKRKLDGWSVEHGKGGS
jgi:hypothetical protein